MKFIVRNNIDFENITGMTSGILVINPYAAYGV